MNLLLDEQLDAAVAASLNALSDRHGLTFRSIREIAPGTKDQEIPGLCRDNSIDALVTANVHDFGAREVLFQALLAAGIHVVVVRPGKETLTPENQLSILVQHSMTIAKRVTAATAPVLIRVTRSSVVERTLTELRAEILGPQRQLP